MRGPTSPPSCAGSAASPADPPRPARAGRPTCRGPRVTPCPPSCSSATAARRRTRAAPSPAGRRGSASTRSAGPRPRPLAQRLAPLPLAAVVTSPLQRCRETTEALAPCRGPRAPSGPSPVDDRLGEARYGDWTGRRSRTSRRNRCGGWSRRTRPPSTFPGEQASRCAPCSAGGRGRARCNDAAVGAAAGDDAVWVAVSHGDVIKAVLADALGMHLDAFQRIVVDPCSVASSATRRLRPFVAARQRHRRATSPGSCPRPADAGARRAGASEGSRRRRRRTRSSAAAPRPRRVADMPRQVFVYDPPERFVAGTVGEPGAAHLLPAGPRRQPASPASPWRRHRCEVLAERVDELLDEVLRAAAARRRCPRSRPSDAEDNEPLDARSRRSSGSAR